MKLLFVCTHNACRSVLAEVLARAIAGDRLQVASAGSQPAGRIHPLALEQLAAAGYDTAGLRSKGYDDVRDFAPDVVITVCDDAAGESCPAWLGTATRTHWGLPDPSRLAGVEAVNACQRVMATLRKRFDALLEQPFETLDNGALAALLLQLGKIG